VLRDLQLHVIARVPNEEQGKDKSQNGKTDPEVEGLRPEAIAFGKIAGEEGRDADGEISGKPRNST
jgi:hypothetical protein